MRLPKEPEIPAQINIVSMIDVIFSILAFFLVSSVYLTRSEGLDVNLPKASTATVQKTEQINVSIKADGAIALNRQPIQLEQLQTSVQQLVKPEVSAMVVLNADEKVQHGRVVAVMDRLRQIEGVQLAIAAQRPQ
ncbi:MAG: biopolymer transporter ExbD [Hydrococcus sp. RM1_1_31]|nr:biopolymer transporter ExbD [Hydrococcus sp. RM1_1_31]